MEESVENAWYDCPCNNYVSLQTTPQYVGNDYYCESGVPIWNSQSFYYNDPLWDGNQCDYMEYPTQHAIIGIVPFEFSLEHRPRSLLDNYTLSICK